MWPLSYELAAQVRIVLRQLRFNDGSLAGPRLTTSFFQNLLQFTERRVTVCADGLSKLLQQMVTLPGRNQVSELFNQDVHVSDIMPTGNENAFEKVKVAHKLPSDISYFPHPQGDLRVRFFDPALGKSGQTAQDQVLFIDADLYWLLIRQAEYLVIV